MRAATAARRGEVTPPYERLPHSPPRADRVVRPYNEDMPSSASGNAKKEALEGFFFQIFTNSYSMLPSPSFSPWARQVRQSVSGWT